MTASFTSGGWEQRRAVCSKGVGGGGVAIWHADEQRRPATGAGARRGHERRWPVPGEGAARSSDRPAPRCTPPGAMERRSTPDEWLR
ncbi:unnamed protein product [Urochloa humidicola]